MPRYLPVQLDAANEDIKAVYDQVERSLGFVPNFIKTLAHSDNHLQPVAGFYTRLIGETALSEKIRQLAILKTCKVQKCQYTVAQHTALAKKAGWTDEQIAAMDSYNASDLFTYYEKEVLELAERVTTDPEEISQEFWTQLDNHFTSNEVVELITFISFYNMLNRIILSIQIEPEPQFQQPAKAAAHR
ncbi:MAG: peroxidase-related enzyme [Acidobacteria bacterium]|nr:peroxidase-related enzyme [Acidobacteriota bacterium]